LTKGQNTNNPVFSSFWLDDDLLKEHSEPKSEGFTKNLIELAAYRRVISNFVCILTNQNIPVRFSSDENSDVNFTDGQSIWLSASIRRKADFDWSVGIALHEAAHIKLSNFDVVKRAFVSGVMLAPSHVIQKAKEKKISKDQLSYLCKWVFNVVEDRYIDSYIFKEAPGYRGYYQAMYEEIWNSDDISDGIKSNLMRIPNLKSFEFRFVNFTNPHTDLDALPGLKDIAETLDLSNILRLKTTEDRLEMAYKVVYIILDNIGRQPESVEVSGTDSTIEQVSKMLKQRSGKGKPEEDTKPQDKEEKESRTEFDPNSKEEKKSEEPEEDSSQNDSDTETPEEPENLDKVVEKALNKLKGDEKSEDADEPIGANDEGDTSEFEKKKLNRIRKQFEQQQKMLQHDYREIKERISTEDKKLLDIIENVGIVMLPAEFKNEGSIENSKIDCIVVQKLTKELIHCGRKVFPMAAAEIAPGNNFQAPREYEDAVSKGFLLGKLLGKKLQIRGETNIVKYIRKLTGKIERRLLSGIGAGSKDIFNKSIITRYNRLRLHLSVDASGSMINPSKWCSTITCVTAICVAASMTENLEVSVSFRCTHQLGDGIDLPYIVLAYDSSVDKISKVKSLFPFLKPNGCTPEGLAFEAIMKGFIVGKRTDGQDHYFVNISDGEPFYNMRANGKYPKISYHGDAAAEHTKKQVEKIRKQDVRVLSYFIESDDENPFGMLLHSSENLKADFSKMYGKDAKFIDVTNVFDIAKTMNHLFLYGE
jgi:hypothetical protein